MGRKLDQIFLNSKNIKSPLIALLGFLQISTKEQCYHCITKPMYVSYFSGKVHCKACCGGMKKWDAMFLCRSPLLNTMVLNDKVISYKRPPEHLIRKY